MVLASDSGQTFGIAFVAFVVVCGLLFAIRPRDLAGRRRAGGCAVGLILFFGLFFGAFVVWASNHIF